MQRDPRVYLLDIQEASRAAIRFCAGKTFANYLDDDMLRMAVERALSIVGEAVMQLVKTEDAMASRIADARSIIGFRNVLIHQYAEIDDEIVWASVQTKLPALLSTVESLLKKIDADS